MHRSSLGRGASLTIEFRVVPRIDLALDVRYVISGRFQWWTTPSGRGSPPLMFNGGPGYYDYQGTVAETIDDLCRVK